MTFVPRPIIILGVPIRAGHNICVLCGRCAVIDLCASITFCYECVLQSRVQSRPSAMGNCCLVPCKCPLGHGNALLLSLFLHRYNVAALRSTGASHGADGCPRRQHGLRSAAVAAAHRKRRACHRLRHTLQASGSGSLQVHGTSR